MRCFWLEYSSKYIYITLLLFIYKGIVYADNIEYINTMTGNVDSVNNSIPTRNIEYCSDGLIVTYYFNHIMKQQDDIYSDSYLLKIDGFYLPDTPQLPAIPFRNEKFILPSGTEGSIQIIDSMSIDYNVKLSPSRPSLDDSSYTSYDSINVPNIISYLGYYPNTLVNEGENTIFEGNNVFNYCISPVKYNNESKVAKIYNFIKIKIEYRKASRVLLNNYKAGVTRQQTSTFLNNITANGINYVMSSTPDSLVLPYDYLIISVPDYRDAVEEFAKWKMLLGFNVHTLYNNDWSASSIKSCIDSVYFNSPNLAYALLVGDHDVLPAMQKENKYYLTNNQDTYYYTDYPYGLINNDTYQEVLIGRLSVSSLESAITVVEKIIDYEKNPPTDSSFYKTGLNVAYFVDKEGDVIDNNKFPDGYEDRRYVQTTEEIASYLTNCHNFNVNRVYVTDNNSNPTNWSKYYSFGDSIPYYLTREAGFNWSGTSQDVVNRINDGVSYVIHRDHGTVLTWEKALLNPVKANQLNNNRKLPIVFSINCKSGDFTFSECLAEALQRKNNGGSVATIAAMNTSYSGYNDILLMGMINAVWPVPGIIINLPNMSGTLSHTIYPEYRIGHILQQGLARLDESKYNFFGSSNSNKIFYTKDIYELFGDPSMNYYTNVPYTFDNVDIFKTPDSIFVNLAHNSAFITFYNKINNSIQVCYGNNAACKNVSDSIKICISKCNFRPYIVNSVDCDLYIQDVDIMGGFGHGTKSLGGKNVRIGSNVTDKKTIGPVVFVGGKIEIKGESTTISGETTINKYTILSISKKQ